MDNHLKLNLNHFYQKNHHDLLSFIKQCSEINTFSHNHKGIEDGLKFVQSHSLSSHLSKKRIPLKHCPSLLKLTHTYPTPVAKLLCVIHIDTVHSPESRFKLVSETQTHLRGPGVTDAKGGLALMLLLTKAIAEFKLPINVSCLINPDEEIGSTSSRTILIREAKKHTLGIVFEPQLENGSFASRRKSSTNFSITVIGKESHAGRYFEKGISAITEMCKLMASLNKALPSHSHRTLNVGKISGGSALNVVPALCRVDINLRCTNVSTYNKSLQILHDTLVSFNTKSPATATLSILSDRPVKPFTAPTKSLINTLIKAGKHLNRPITFEATGGVCDGNILASAGLPTLDSCGVAGEGIHTNNEKMVIQSLHDNFILLFHFLNLLTQKRK